MNNTEAEILYKDIENDAVVIWNAAKDGDDKAQRVIDLHRMCVKNADVPTVTLLSCAYKDWKSH